MRRFLDSLPARPQLLGLGEPTHLAQELLRTRNRIFRTLVEHAGYRSIAIESDAGAGLAVDAYVAGGPAPLDEVMATGFSHDFGTCDGNRELVEWMRRENAARDPDDRLRFDGFDGPMEMTSAGSPRGPLRALHGYLAEHLGAARLPCDAATIDRIAGEDTGWTHPAALMDASRSPGDSPAARELRVVADDLAALLAAETPALVAESREAWHRARLDARTSTGLLRYHAVLADPSPARLSRACEQRDALMAANLAAIAEREARRGPTLVFAQNSHLQRVPSTMHMAGMDLRWWSAGAITAATAGEHYAFIAMAIGSLPARGLGAPAPDTIEGVLAGMPPGIHLAADVRAAARGRKLALRSDMTPRQGYGPLDPEHLGGADGVLFLPEV